MTLSAQATRSPVHPYLQDAGMVTAAQTPFVPSVCSACGGCRGGVLCRARRAEALGVEGL